MAQKELTPAEFTFHSFRHSQGIMWSQLYIFRYFDLNFDLKPDLHPTAGDHRRYLQYIGHTGVKTHMQYNQPDASKAGSAVIDAFKSLRRFANTPANVRHVNRFDELSIPRALVSSLLTQEKRILGAQKPWRAYSNDKDYGHVERLKHRVTSGKGSLVLYHGRDGRTTGIPQFDQMYTDMWNATEQHEGRNKYLANLVDDHAFALESAECLFAETEADQHLSA
jgi:hypothetical protein